MTIDWQFLQTLLQNQAVQVSLVFLGAALLTFFSQRIMRRLLRLSRFAPESHRFRNQRQATLNGILAGLLSVAAFSLATLFCVGQFVDLSTLVWVVGLFSAAFGLGFRPIISDFLTGMVFIFEDTLDVGEKVSIVGPWSVFEGVVEKVTLRTVHLRGISGELMAIPNGEIRIIRNYSRGQFSSADIVIKIASKDIQPAINVLVPLGEEAMKLFADLLEPWRVISDDDAMGQSCELRILVKARFAHAAELRPRLQALIQQRLAAAQVELAD
jgi:moderate conductance mechanosensitive channel